MGNTWRELREKQEENLSIFAAKSSNSKGRVHFEEKCPVRTDFERDGNRILYSMEFRRLRHKTQVFFNAKNDHICTRMEHVLYVSSISQTIARTLNLNQDLTNAIALGHDLGHAPFGHSGEGAINSCVKKYLPESGFKHELHSLRVVDKLATRISQEKIDSKCGLNLTFEVRDGIACHCGENFNEFYIERDINKPMKALVGLNTRAQKPSTLEACIVRLVDKIAYVGRDIEDAVRVNLLNMDDISMEIRKVLGNTNGQIINTLVMDMIENSYERDYISLSSEKGEALSALISENYRLIYRADRILRYEKQAKNIVEGLFENLLSMLDDIERLKKSELKVHRMFYSYIQNISYKEDESNVQKAVDFIAGMTDSFAMNCFEEIYWF